jgi:predicted heme/steroid binding protein
MKRIAAILATLMAVLAFIPPASSSARSPIDAGQTANVTIESWLQATPSKTLLSGSVKACFKLKGGVVDQGGSPAWTDDTYGAVPSDASRLADKCAGWQPVGGFVMVPPVPAPSTANPPPSPLRSLYAVHTLAGQKGQLFITFAGTYDLDSTATHTAAYTGTGTWYITGGTGAYLGVQGEGTWMADAATLPNGYIRHTEKGRLSFPARSEALSLPAQKVNGKISIEALLQANMASTMMSGNLKTCFKLRGAIADLGGAPRWKDGALATLQDLAARAVARCQAAVSCTCRPRPRVSCRSGPWDC